MSDSLPVFTPVRPRGRQLILLGGEGVEPVMQQLRQGGMRVVEEPAGAFIPEQPGPILRGGGGGGAGGPGRDVGRQQQLTHMDDPAEEGSVSGRVPEGSTGPQALHGGVTEQRAVKGVRPELLPHKAQVDLEH